MSDKRIADEQRREASAVIEEAINLLSKKTATITEKISGFKLLDRIFDENTSFSMAGLCTYSLTLRRLFEKAVRSTNPQIKTLGQSALGKLNAHWNRLDAQISESATIIENGSPALPVKSQRVRRPDGPIH